MVVGGGAAAAQSMNMRKKAKEHGHDGDSEYGEAGAGELTRLDSSMYEGWRKYQPHARRLYNQQVTQVGVACLIGANFIINIAQAQFDPSGTLHTAVFDGFELFFNIVFLIELVLNMYGHWLCDFWCSGWNVFDFTVVVIGWLFQFNAPLPGFLQLLRTMRAFRVFRLFKRVQSLRKILESLARAVPGVTNAFMILAIVMCIYAIIAVDRFHSYGANRKMINELGQEVDLATGRDQPYGYEYFGNFGKALYTMFQVLTGESWSEAVARPLINSSDVGTALFAVFFFVSFQIVCGIVLVNVVVAVLLEKMVDEEPQTDFSEEDEFSDGLSSSDSKSLESMQGDIVFMKEHLEIMRAAVLKKLSADAAPETVKLANGTTEPEVASPETPKTAASRSMRSNSSRKGKKTKENQPAPEARGKPALGEVEVEDVS